MKSALLLAFVCAGGVWSLGAETGNGLRSVSDVVTVTNLKRATGFQGKATCFVENTGCGFDFMSGRRFSVTFQSDHGCDCLWTVDETHHRKRIDNDFSGVWDKDGFQVGDLVFGQYDFTVEMPDELVVIAARDSDRKDSNDGFIHCGVNIFTLQADEWVLSGVMNANDVLGSCEVQFKVNKVTIPRHVSGQLHQITYQNGRFESTGDSPNDSR